MFGRNNFKRGGFKSLCYLSNIFSSCVGSEAIFSNSIAISGFPKNAMSHENLKRWAQNYEVWLYQAFSGVGIAGSRVSEAVARPAKAEIKAFLASESTRWEETKENSFLILILPRVAGSAVLAGEAFVASGTGTLFHRRSPSQGCCSRNRNVHRHIAQTEETKSVT